MMPDEEICPDCREGKHKACLGEVFIETLGDYGPCVCDLVEHEL